MRDRTDRTPWHGQADRPPRVWAPAAGTVVMEVGGPGGGAVPLAPAGGGWWVAPEPLGAHVAYAFRVDGEGPFPDPRSPWQPEGVDGPSRTVAPGDHAWGDDGWGGLHLPSALVYELHVGTFTGRGTFDGAVERLDYLEELGVTAVELMPVNQFPGHRGWGYDGVDLFAVHAPYGGPQGMKRFVDACHARGLGVIQDVVYNHLGPSGNYLGRFGPYFTDAYHTPWGAAVNFDQGGSDEVRRFVIDNALMWFREYHVDALRLDAVHAIFDRSAVHVLEQMAVEVEALEAELGRPLRLVAESDLNDPRLLWSRERGGYGLDAQWSDDFHHALHAALTGERVGYYADFGRLGDIARALEEAYVYGGRHSGYRDRVHGRSAAGLRGSRFLGYLQNHDQVGNRAVGDRLAARVSTGLLKVGAALVLTSPFVPLLFQGEEWGASTPFQYFTDHADPELGEAVRRGRRGEFAAFGWKPEHVPDPQDPDTFRRSRLDWSESARLPHREILDWYRALIRLRRAVPALADGDLSRVRAQADEEARTLEVERGPVSVLCNLSGEARVLGGPGGNGGEAAGGDAGRLLLASTGGVRAVPGGWSVPGEAAAIVVRP